MSSKHFLVLLTLLCLFSCSGCAGMLAANAAGSMLKSDEDPNALPGPVLKSPATVIDNDFHFSFTVPAGWRLHAVEQKPESKDRKIVYSRSNCASTRFTICVNRMPSNFPVKSSVKKRLRLFNRMVKKGKLESAKARDVGQSRKNRIKGWETVDSEKGTDGMNRKILWQCYSPNNYRFCFSAESPAESFETSRQELRGIMDSISFRPPGG